MLVGYNTNISFKGTIYHVQTEDNGTKNPVIITFLYHKGAILASKKVSYSHLLQDADWKQKAKTMMKDQHHGMIKELQSGRYTGGGDAVEAEAYDDKDRSEKRLDDILIEFIIGKG
ncbi:MAG: hypothetical protein HY805_02200 [Nitrospirae bacterium]|nr:hypothetical protein [Nitrospirota bacterium]